MHVTSTIKLISFFIFVCSLASAIQQQRLWKNCCQIMHKMTCQVCAHGLIVSNFILNGLLLCTLLIPLLSFALSNMTVSSLFVLDSSDEILEFNDFKCERCDLFIFLIKWRPSRQIIYLSWLKWNEMKCSTALTTCLNIHSFRGLQGSEWSER